VTREYNVDTQSQPLYLTNELESMYSYEG